MPPPLAPSDTHKLVRSNHPPSEKSLLEAKNPQDGTRDFSPIILGMDTSSLDLVYLDRDPSTNLPSAGVCLKANMRIAAYAGVKAECLITRPCLNFIELDAEIRRLHAELDEIRARAKKKFYKAEATAVGAA